MGELASHTHHLRIYDAGGVAGGGGYVPASSLIVGSVIVHTGSNETLTAGTFTDRPGTGVCTERDQMDNAGSNTKHNNLSSFIVTYCYKRKS